MKEVFNQEVKLTPPQGKVLNLVLSWLERHGFSEEDCQEAKDLWLEYLRCTDSGSDQTLANTNLWAAAVLYLLGKQRGNPGLNLPQLAAAFGVSVASISQRGEKIFRTLKFRENDYGANLIKFKGFFPSESAAKAFHKVITFTQRSEKLMSDVAAVFEEFVLWEVAPISLDLLLELLLFIACDRTVAGKKSIIDLYLEDVEESRDCSGEELDFLHRLQASRFSLFQVEASPKQGCFRFKDIFRGDELLVAADESLTIPAGIMMGRIMPVDTGGESRWQPGIHLCLIKPEIVDELETTAKRWFWQYSLANNGWATGEDFIRENGYRFYRWYHDHYPDPR